MQEEKEENVQKLFINKWIILKAFNIHLPIYIYIYKYIYIIYIY